MKMTLSEFFMIKQMENYFAPRDTSFQKFISSILNKSGVNQKNLDLMISGPNFHYFSAAFTSPEVSDKNYEWLEQIGDVAHAKFFVPYVYQRFPKLQCDKGVKIVARLKIKHVSREEFAKIGEKLNLWPWISARVLTRDTQRKKLLEDVFEALLGAIEFCGNMSIVDHFGFIVVSEFLKSVYDQQHISLKYEDLVDAKSRLKELYDINKNFGSLVYNSVPVGDKKFHSTEIIFNGAVIGAGQAFRKIDAEQITAAKALQNLSNMGFNLEPPPEYLMFEKEYH